ncbi:MAG TPA: hypothetical protein VFZ47_04615 [Chitinophagaceae bacterium]
MKRPYIYLILLCFLAATFISTKPTTNLFADNCKNIIDSAKMFVETSDFAVNHKPSKSDPEANLKIDKWLVNLSFKKLTCLLNSKDPSLKAVGFLYASQLYMDSVMKNYSHLLNDTTSVQLYFANGRTSPKMKLGEILTSMVKTFKKTNDQFDKRPEVENIVSNFIRQYATYPETYKPISFPNFRVGFDNEGPTGFNIRHEFELRNNDGKTEKVIYAFALTPKMRITVIEKDSTNYGMAIPSKLESWLKPFGRKLDGKDSTTLGLR